MKISRPAWPDDQLGRVVEVQMKIPGDASRMSQFAMKSLSRNASLLWLSLRPR
jgi:hypothetical protein